MSTAEINPIWRALVFAAIAAAAGTLAFSGARHALAAYWARPASPETWLRAAQSEPSNPELWYQLARYDQTDFEHTDLPLAIAYYQRATSLDPNSSFYWMDFGSAYESAGDSLHAEQAFRRARQLYPISADAAWRLGNFLLRQGRVTEAFQQIHNALAIDPKLTTPAISLCWRSTPDISQILASVLPDEPAENWAALQFFTEANEPLPAIAVWRRIAASHKPFPASDAFPLLDMLIATGHGDDAQTVWNQSLLAAGVRDERDANGSLLSNGSFEKDPLNGGFDWRLRATEGAELSWDEQSVHSGQRSLRLDFDGTTNANFEGVWQYVAVSPATRYRLSAFVRTEDVTTDSGLRVEVRDVSRPGTPVRSTPNVVGTQPWSEENLEFLTGPDTKLLQIVIRRTPSDRLGNKIRGTAWVDDARLEPISHPAGTPQ